MTTLKIITPSAEDKWLEELPDRPSIEDVLHLTGPEFPKFEGNPDGVPNWILFGRLNRFCTAVWRLATAVEREVAAQFWIDYLTEHSPAIKQPWHIVKAGMAAAAGAAAGGARPMQWRWFDDQQITELPATIDLISGHLPEGAFAVCYGPSGHGKSFVVQDVALCVASGLPWAGFTVRRGPVAYIAAEGVGGIGPRVEAWKLSRRYEQSAGVQFLPHPIQVIDSPDPGQLLAELASWPEPPKLVVIDTLAQCMAGGDENSVEDMSRMIQLANQLRRTYGCTVIVVHHTGRDGDQERGSTALRGAADTMFKIKREEGTIVVSCDKQKDGVPFEPLRFRLAAVGRSCVPMLIGDAAEDGDELGDGARKCLQALIETVHDENGLSATAWKQCSELLDASFYRYRKTLIDLGLVECVQKRYRPTVKGHQLSAIT